MDAPADLVAALFAQSPFGTAVYDTSGRFSAGNAAYERHWGIRIADVPGEWSLFTDVQLEEAGFTPLLRRAFAGEHVVLPPVEYDAARATGALGRTVWTQGHCFPLRDAAGVVTHVAVTFVDVTHHVETERAVEAARHRLEVIVDRLPTPTAIAVGPDLVIGAANDAYRHLVGGRDLLGRPFADAFPELVAEGYLAMLELVRDTGEARRGEGVTARWDRDGSGALVEGVIDFLYESLPATGAYPAGVVMQVIDRTEHARVLRDAEEARLRAEEANAAKAQFLATMSHELRTPLNAIAGYVQLLEMGIHGPVTPEQQEALRRVARAEQHLLSLINDVLNYARLESGRVEYDIAPVRVADVVGDIVGMLEPQFAAKGIRLVVQVPDESGAPMTPATTSATRVLADREKLGQVLLNLLSNAVKFTRTGGHVTVEVVTRAADGPAPAPDLVFLRVADTGIGIPADKLEAIFEPFVQVGGGYAREGGGAGLGLAISRDLARGMGGELRARSTAGRGSSFTVTLRRADTPLSPG